MEKIIEILNRNYVICLPTETVMGLACKANKEAYYNLVELKNRPLNKAFPLCLLKSDIELYCEVNDLQRKVINHFLPGPLTIVLKKKKDVSNFIGNGMETVAIRCSEDKFLTDVLKSIETPLFLTSANKAGEEVCKTLLEARNVFKDKIEVYVEGNPTGTLASTIVDLTTYPRILRQGKITIDEILKVWEE